MTRRPLAMLFFLLAIIAGWSSHLAAQVYGQSTVQIQSGQVHFHCETQGQGFYVQTDYYGVDVTCNPSVPATWTCQGGPSHGGPWDATCDGVAPSVPGTKYVATGQHNIDFLYNYWPQCFSDDYYDQDGFSDWATLQCTGSCSQPVPFTQDKCYALLSNWEVIQTTAWDTAILISPKTVTLLQSQTVSFSTNWGAGNAIWTILSGPGTINASGLYTAPSTITSSQTAVIRACVSTELLNCDTATVNLQPPWPVITGIKVNGSTTNALQAPSTQTITLTGTNFGTSDQIAVVNGSAFVTVNSVGTPVLSNGQYTVTFTVTTAATATGGTASFKLIRQDGANATSPSITINPYMPPVPKIMMVTSSTAQQTCLGGSQIDGQTTPVYAGQQILLCSPAPAPALPAPLTVTSSSWTVPPPNSVNDLTGGFVASSNSGIELAAILNQPSATFYWVVPENLETMTYTYCVNNSTTQCATSAGASFDVSGPTGNLLPTVNITTNIAGTAITFPQTGSATLQMTNAPPPNSTDGIWLQENATVPQGSFIWVQVLKSSTFSQLVSTGFTFTPPTSAVNQLDGIYPYPSGPPTGTPGMVASDGPGRPLYSGLGEAAEAFDANLYVLWDPAIPPAGQPTCTTASVDTSTTPYTAHPSTCSSIPVPLASVEWKWSACAINTGAGASPSWLLSCGMGYASLPAASGYPEWSSCYISRNGGCD